MTKYHRIIWFSKIFAINVMSPNLNLFPDLNELFEKIRYNRKRAQRMGESVATQLICDLNAMSEFVNKVDYNKKHEVVKKAVDFENELSFEERLNLIPKIDPNVVAGYNLLEELVRFKLKNTLDERMTGGGLWNKFYKEYEKELYEINVDIDDANIENDVWYLLFYNTETIGGKKIISKHRNIDFHEIPHHKPFEQYCEGEWASQYEEYQLSVKILEEMYSIIEQLPQKVSNQE